MVTLLLEITSTLFSVRIHLTPLKEELAKPIVVLVYEPSFLRYWMARALRDKFRLHIFSGTDEALDFVRSTPHVDVLITELDFRSSALGGCNIAREVDQRFRNASIFVFLNGDSDDHRLMMLRGIKTVRFLTKPFDAFFLVRYVENATTHKQKTELQI